jgi:hypothetical protein
LLLKARAVASASSSEVDGTRQWEHRQLRFGRLDINTNRLKGGPKTVTV